MAIRKVLTLLLLLHLSITTCFSATGAEKTRLLIIDSARGEPYSTLRTVILGNLEKQGYKQDSNFEVSYWSLGNAVGLAQRAWITERDRQYDAVFLNGTVATAELKKYAFNNDSFAFIFGAVTDPVGIGVIDNFSTAPKGNFTGLSYPVQVVERLRFISKLFPGPCSIGYIYADMPQSKSYNIWLEEALKLDEFKHLSFHFRKVEFVKGEQGHIRMASLAEEHVLELNSRVDLFLSPNDQMGVQRPFADIMVRSATKPLIGVGRKDVMEKWGATASIYPSLDSSGSQIADMLVQVFKGADIKDIIPQYPPPGIAINLRKAEEFGLNIPEDILNQADTEIIR